MALAFKYLNGNPWQREDIPDCTLRACSIALNRSYIDLCRKFRVKYTLGRGLAESEESAGTINKILEVGDGWGFFRTWDMDYIMDKFMASNGKDPDSFVDSEEGLTVSEQCSLLPNGRYLFFVRPRKNSLHEDWHCTYVNNTMKYYRDTFQCATSGTRVFGYVQINPEAILPSTNPKSKAVEIAEINKGNLWGDEHPIIYSKRRWDEMVKSGNIPENVVGRIAYYNMKESGYI